MEYVHPMEQNSHWGSIEFDTCSGCTECRRSMIADFGRTVTTALRMFLRSVSAQICGTRLTTGTMRLPRILRTGCPHVLLMIGPSDAEFCTSEAR